MDPGDLDVLVPLEKLRQLLVPAEVAVDPQQIYLGRKSGKWGMPRIQSEMQQTLAFGLALAADSTEQRVMSFRKKSSEVSRKNTESDT